MLRRSFAVLVSLVALAGAVHAGGAAAATPKAPSPTKGVVLVSTDLALQQASAAGTGIVLTRSGEVLTNNHVIAGATTIKVTVPATKRTYAADVVGYDVTDDVALLKLEGASNLATATMGNSANLKIGQVTRAVGNANGRGKLVVTTGKILGLNRTITVQQDDGSSASLSHLVMTSSRLVRGDSGGALLNASGRVIGLNAAGSTSTTPRVAAPGFAVAINHALTITRQIEALRASPLVHIGETAFVGIGIDDSSGRVAVASVFPGSPAEAAGLAAGDVITSIDGTPISSRAGLRKILFGHHPGDQITVGYTDTAGNALTVTITLGTGPPQ
jgi:S1-C subfamily serine protease